MKRKKTIYVYPRLEKEINNNKCSISKLCNAVDISYSGFISARTGYTVMFPAYKEKLSEFFGVEQNELFKRSDVI